MLFSVLAFATGALASFANNLNYRSPSHNHPGLGVSIHKVQKRNDLSKAFSPDQLNFTHGVASGDPLATSVILWTRLAPMVDDVKDNSTVSGYVPLYNPVPIYNENGTHIKPSNAPVCLQYKIATDSALKNVKDSGTLYTSSDVDYTVKVEAQHLAPFTLYYYQFNVCNSNKTSSVGRTKTSPGPNDNVENVKLAIYSCSNYTAHLAISTHSVIQRSRTLLTMVRFLHYLHATATNILSVIHLGDVIYEYKEGDYGYGYSIDRIPLPDREIYTLYDYRKRHATYRADSGFLASTQKFAWLPVWDDHEVSDNTYRDGASELNNTESSFIQDGGVSVDQRKMNAVRAYYEWMPIRQVDMDDNLRIWRNFQIGKLVDIILLDTRHYDRSITDLYWNTEYVNLIKDDAGRSMMGSRQENWFYNNLIKSKNRGATWRLIGSQTVFSHLSSDDVDAWDGYTSNRNRTFQTLYDNGIGNNIMISGDSHANWVSDLTWLDTHPYNNVTGEGSVGVEFAGTAVSSPSPVGANISIAAANTYSKALVAGNRELQWSELYYRGYYELSISPNETKAQYFGLPTLLTSNGYEISLANFTVKAGENRLSRAGGVGGGKVENGALKGGETVATNLTHDVTTGVWQVKNFTGPSVL